MTINYSQKLVVIDSTSNWKFLMTWESQPVEHEAGAFLFLQYRQTACNVCALCLGSGFELQSGFLCSAAAVAVFDVLMFRLSKLRSASLDHTPQYAKLVPNCMICACAVGYKYFRELKAVTVLVD